MNADGKKSSAMGNSHVPIAPSIAMVSPLDQYAHTGIANASSLVINILYRMYI